jgi:hypothetical protein
MFKNKQHSSWKQTPLKMLFFVVVFVAFAATLSWLIMFLWNNILTEVTGVKPLNFWKAAGLLLLAKILFGGFRRRRPNRRGPGSADWRTKWMQMSEEERLEAKSKWKEHCRKRHGRGSSEQE